MDTSKWDAIKQDVEDNGDVYTTTMEVLRDAHGAAKLGVHVRTAIRKSLAGIGLGHVPEQLPKHQHQPVRLYKRGTEVGDIIERVLAPGQENDLVLRERFSGENANYAEIVEQIRDLVGE